MADELLGADAFIEQLIAGGVRHVFGNPGTPAVSSRPDVEPSGRNHRGVGPWRPKLGATTIC